MELVKQVIENQKQITVLSEERDQFAKANKEEITKLKWEIYRPKIQALENERDAKVEALSAKREAKAVEINKKIEEKSVIITKVERILTFLKLRSKDLDLTIKDPDVKAYRDRHIESLGYIFTGKFLKIKLFIVENDKPKNKYSLIAVGRSLFDKEWIGLPYSYAVPTWEQGWFTLKVVIKDLPTIDELKQYLLKWKKSILNRYLGKYRTVYKEYKEVLESYKIEDFQELIKYRCKCGFFYSINDVKHMNIRETVKCTRCGETMESQETS